MKTAIRNAAFAIAAAASLAPAAVRACEPQPPQPAVRFDLHAGPGTVNAQWIDRADRDGRGADWDRGGRDGGRWEREREWRERQERMERERAELRADYARLDEARARFYASPHRPWRARQFEAWYADQRAALDARWQGVIAWR
jgi:hypothetical protein